MSDYNIERKKHYLDIKSAVKGFLIGIIVLLIVSILVSMWGLTTDFKILYLCLIVLLILFLILYIMCAIGLYVNSRIIKQAISYDNIINNSDNITLEFLEHKLDRNYKILGVYETQNVLIIEFWPYLLNKNVNKFKPIISLVNKKLDDDSTWKTISKSDDAMKTLKKFKQFTEKNSSNKLRYIGSQSYYFKHLDA